MTLAASTVAAQRRRRRPGLARHLELVTEIARRFPELSIMSGNVVHPDDCHRVMDAGARIVRVGYSGGSVNDGRSMFGVGRSQGKAILDCAAVCRERRVSLVADGGVSSPGDAAIALALGASHVMLGRLFAMCTDSPCARRDEAGARIVVSYRGMSRTELLDGLPAEGRCVELECVRTLAQTVEWLADSLCVSFAKAGCASLQEFRDCCELEFQTEAARVEAGVRS